MTDDRDLPPDLPDDELADLDAGELDLDERASARLDGLIDLTDHLELADGLEAPVARRRAEFEQLRAALQDVPAPPEGALDRAVAAALAAYDEARPGDGDAPAEGEAVAPPVALRPRRRARWLAPLGAAAAVAALLGVAAVADRGDDDGAASVAQAPAPEVATAGGEAADASGRAAGAERSGAAPGPGSGSDEASTLMAPPPTTTTPMTPAAAPSSLGSFATLDDLAAARAGQAELTEAAPPTSEPQLDGAVTPSPCLPGARPLGTAQLAGRPVVVVERPDGSLAAYDGDCRLVDELAPASPSTTAP